MIIEFSTWIEVEERENKDEMIQNAWAELEKQIKENGTTIFSAFTEEGDGI